MNDEPAADDPDQGRGHNSATTKSRVEPNDTHDGNSTPHQNRKRDTGNFRQSLAKTEFWLATGTWALVVVTWIIVSDARSAAERAQRAWVAPKQMVINGQIPEDGGLNVAVLLENEGKEPATGVVWHLADPLLTDLIPEQGAEDIGGPSNDNDSCFGLRSDNNRGSVIYPQSDTLRTWLPFSLPRNANSANIIAAAKESKGSMFVDGCIAYWTAGAMHTSRFRFLWRSIHGAPPSSWAFQSVSSGNHAD